LSFGRADGSWSLLRLAFLWSRFPCHRRTLKWKDVAAGKTVRRSETFSIPKGGSIPQLIVGAFPNNPIGHQGAGRDSNSSR
jgi:hypothetical protein